MFPVLFSVGSLTVYTFGFFIALALIAGLFLFWRYGKQFIPDTEAIFDAAFSAIIAGFLGGRLLFIVLHPLLFWPRLYLAFNVFQVPGFLYYGAVVGALLGLVWYARNHRLPMRQVLDIAAIATSFGHAIGLIGAFLAGTAYGAVTALPWGVPMVGLIGKREPVQLIEAFVELVIFAGLTVWYGRRRHYAGMGAIAYLLSYSVARIFIEFLRGDSVYWGPLRSQWILSLLVIIGTLLYYIRRFRLTRRQKL